jgi:hypothetical protein
MRSIKTILSLIILSFIFSINSSAQESYTVNGVVKDSLSGETLIGVTLKFSGKTQLGTSTNAYGFFSYKLTAGTYDLSVSYVGYRTIFKKISISADSKLDLNMVPDNVIDEIVISAERRNDNVVNAQMGVAKINLSEIRNVPVLFGERDILKTLQLLPGIKSAGEGNSGFYVRGGSTDQNLIAR